MTRARGPRIARWVYSAPVDGEYVVLSLERSEYTALDRVGSEIWRGLLDGLDAPGLVERLGDIFDVDRRVLEQDVARVLEQLEGRGLLVPVGTTPTAD